jgi:hypothetical protein
MRGTRKQHGSTQRRGADDRTPSQSNHETPRDVIDKVSEEAVKEINRIFEKKEKDSK